MDFKTATDRLMEAVRLPAVARALRVSDNTVARWRVDPAKEARREPSIDWQRAVAKLARKRAAELVRLAEQLDKEG